MSINSQYGEPEESILKQKHIEGFSKMRGLQKFVALFLCVALVMIMGAFVSTKTDAAIKLSSTYNVVQANTKLTLKLNGAKAKKVKWGLSNPNVGILKKGVFTAKWAGMTKIYAKYAGQVYTCKVVVPNPARLVLVNKKKVTITDKSSYQLKAYAWGEVKYYSKNTHIAKVNSKGIIKGENPGTTYVYAKHAYGVAGCKVKVKSAGEQKIIFPKWLYDQKKQAIRKVDSKGVVKYGPLLSTAGKTVTVKPDRLLPLTPGQ